ncbi:TPA: restriction endonuclease subunit S [Enterobacter hormaechei]
MAKYKAYPEYKDSGVEWLGRVPKHWSAKSLKFLCTFNDQVISESAGHDYEIEYVDIGSVNSSQGITKTETMLLSKAPSRARRLVKDGDVIISTVRTYLEAISPIINPPDNMVVSTGFAVIRPSIGLNHAFAAYCLRASGFIKEVVARSVGVSYPAINASDLVNIPVPNMPLTEQLRIANFLDHETAKIDNLIEKQQQLIELLKEKRQAVISHAVTKGLNPDVQMKDSGVEWLGDVPAHWEVKRIKHFGKVIGGFAFKSTDFTDEGYPVIKISNVSHLSFDWGDSSFLPPSFSFTHKEYLAPNGALVFAMTRPVISGGIKVTLLDDDSAPLVNQRVGFMMVRSKNMARYILISTQSSAFLAHYVNNMTVTNQPNISSEGIESIYLPVPPMNEISRILLYVDRMNESYNQLIDKALLQVSLLQERRTALISAAVTGKFDVRDRVAPDTQDIEASQEAIA